MVDGSTPAFAKVTKMIGAEKGSALIRETLLEMGVEELSFPNDRLRFALVLVAKGGLVGAIGSAIKVQALMQGANEAEVLAWRASGSTTKHGP
ncbi:MAG: hypothetical protein JKY37_13010 [Nannocystaceae bacterium]|nr:hypothetical protein [Nannocystaceae bacterium]